MVLIMDRSGSMIGDNLTAAKIAAQNLIKIVVGTEYARSVQTVLIPPHGGGSCRDVQVKCISFVVPETLDVSGNTTAICNARKFSARVLVNYVDTDFTCCDPQTEIQ